MFTPFVQLYLGLILLGLNPFISANVVADSRETKAYLFSEDSTKDTWDDCESRLKLSALKAKKIDTRCLNARHINAESIRTHDLEVDSSLCLPSLIAENVCARTVTTHDLCTSGTTRIKDLRNCGLYLAAATYLTTTTYTLGTVLGFDNVISDPNNNTSIVPYFSYTAPLSGYYVVTLQIDQSMLFPSTGAVFGVPVANPQILRNGVVIREGYSPFVPFIPVQRANLSALVHLDAGDLLTAQYEVIAIDPITGVGPIAGDAILLGGNDENKSILLVHLLSVDCDSSFQCPTPCAPCQPESMVPCLETCIPVTCCGTTYIH